MSYGMKLVGIRQLGVPRVIVSPEHFKALVADRAEYLIDKGAPVTLHALVGFMGYRSIREFDRFPEHKGRAYESCVDFTRFLAESWLVDKIASSDGTTTGQQFILKAIHGYAERQEIDLRAVTVNIEGKDAEC